MLRPLAIVAVLMTAIGAAEPRTDPFAVGALRRDGTVIPFAAFDGKRWSVNWPGPMLELQVPITLSSVPKSWWGPTRPLHEWQVWPLGGEPRTVRVTQPDWVQTHCLRQVALKTDYRTDGPVPPTSEQPYPKDGLAVSPARPVERIERIAGASAEAMGLTAFVTKSFNEAEQETASRFGHAVRRSEREAARVDLEAIYTFGSSPRVYYVEATRGYSSVTLRDRNCSISFGTGWFATDDSGTFVKLDMAVDLLQCNRYGASYMLPLGVMRVDDRVFWIVQYSGWDHERFVVAEVKKDRVDAAVIKAGGGC